MLLRKNEKRSGFLYSSLSFHLYNIEKYIEIEDNILKAILDLLMKASLKSQRIASERLDYFENKLKVIEMYKIIIK